MVAEKLHLPAPASWFPARAAVRHRAAAGANPCLSPGGTLFSGFRRLDPERPLFRLLDECGFRRASDRSDTQRRDYRAVRAICRERAERADPDRGGAQRRRSRRRDALSGHRSRGRAAGRQHRRLAGRRAARIRVGCPSRSRRATRAGARPHPARGTLFVIPGGYRLLVARDISDAAAFRNRVRSTLLWAGLVALGIGLLGGTAMSCNLLRRVELVNRTSERVMAGNLSDRVPLDGTSDEFDQLAANLNRMLDQIERLMTAMRGVTDDVAHDLKTPLARLRARLELALIGPTAMPPASRRDPDRDRRGRPTARDLQCAARHRRGRGGHRARPDGSSGPRRDCARRGRIL